MARENIDGLKFGKLLAIKDGPDIITNNQHRRTIVCQCDCGNTKIIRMNNLINGKTKSCGCERSFLLGEKNKRHGLSKTRIYNIYYNMRNRCLNKTDNRYNDYGGRGITVCEKWMTFEGFYEDMGTSYQDELTIERVDVNGNYCIENCCWIPAREQGRNKKTSKKFQYKGQILCLADISRLVNIDWGTLNYRIFKQGLSLEEAINKEKFSR